jgi:hypothetical protein
MSAASAAPATGALQRSEFPPGATVTNNVTDFAVASQLAEPRFCACSTRLAPRHGPDARLRRQRLARRRAGSRGSSNLRIPGGSLIAGHTRVAAPLRGESGSDRRPQRCQITARLAAVQQTKRASELEKTRRVTAPVSDGRDMCSLSSEAGRVISPSLCSNETPAARERAGQSRTAGRP